MVVIAYSYLESILRALATWNEIDVETYANKGNLIATLKQRKNLSNQNCLLKNLIAQCWSAVAVPLVVVT